MGETRPLLPAMRFAAVYAYAPAAHDWFERRAADDWGTIVLRSPAWSVSETSYYHRTMGSQVVKRLYAFDQLISLEALVGDKELSGGWEAELAAAAELPDPNYSGDRPTRPVNIDSGYLTEAKLVLATTKDREHRLHITRGMFAEVTVQYRKDGWRFPEWTYPDYRRDEVLAFLTEARELLRRRLGRTPR